MFHTGSGITLTVDYVWPIRQPIGPRNLKAETSKICTVTCLLIWCSIGPGMFFSIDFFPHRGFFGGIFFSVLIYWPHILNKFLFLLWFGPSHLIVIVFLISECFVYSLLCCILLLYSQVAARARTVAQYQILLQYLSHACTACSGTYYTSYRSNNFLETCTARVK